MTPDDFALAVELEPQGCFVAMEGTERVGIATCISYGDVGWFGNLIVQEDSRRRGAGSLLVQQAINYLNRRGTRTIGLYAYPQLTGFYSKLGFKPDQDFAVLHAEKPRFRTQTPMQQISRENLEAIIQFDTKCFGANREKLLKKIIHTERNIGFCVSTDGEISGYAMAKVFGDMAEIGPLMCLPKHQDVALNLLCAVGGEVAERRVYVCVPKREAALCSELSAVGFIEDFSVKRMFFGEYWAKNCIYIAESLERG